MADVIKLAGIRVGISGAVPEPHEQQVCGETLIHNTVRRLTERILAAGGNIVYGSHPTFTDVIDGVAEGLFPQPQPERIRMYVGRRFFHPQPGGSDPYPLLTEEQYSAIHRRFAELVWVGAADAPRQIVLDQLRDQFISDADALVCIGGKGARPGIIPGVGQEADIAVKKGRPLFLLAWAGGYTATLYQHWAQHGLLGSRLQNRLSDEENQKLADPAEAFQSIDLVLKGLSRILRA